VFKLDKNNQKEFLGLWNRINRGGHFRYWKTQESRGQKGTFKNW
jgi:hypothetical protein